ncbi:hypothetical protein [Microseira wollei]|nr:hypothetical protein [Microseira wollei]
MCTQVMNAIAVVAIDADDDCHVALEVVFVILPRHCYSSTE